jgi:formylglycine-generating enzyme required for sulfatase activity
MRPSLFFAASAFLAAFSGTGTAIAADAPLIYETPAEFFGNGDFDGDGRGDLVIVDKETGKYRIAYQLNPGTFSWVDNRPSGIKGLSGFSIGKLLATNLDALAFTSPDGTEITVLDASSATAPSKPVRVPFNAAIGPSTVVAVDIGGPGNTSLADLYVGSIYNSPDANLATLLRNGTTDFPTLAEVALPGVPARANPLPVQAGVPDMVCLILSDDKGASFRVENLRSGKPALAANVPGLPAGSEYALGHFRGTPLPEIILYSPGEKQISVRAARRTGDQIQLGAPTSFDLGEAVRRVVALENGNTHRLFIVFGDGEKAGLFNFDASKAPALAQSIVITNELITCAEAVSDGFIVFSHSSSSKFTTRYQVFKASGDAYVTGPFGTLPTLADNDNITVPDIHARIEARLSITNESQMTPYTNSIPGTPMKYSMVPIPGGEFVMGSPEGETGRKEDEGPQHQVKISPFWMGQFEVTWNEYELFMYPDQEKQTRETMPTDKDGDKLADVVTHPSRPYVEMSFGMGKNGFPAISMTQHGANKYCQWLSAKTGEFYRLPTEAEWEYACRAGTKTAYFFGNDPSKLGEYAWYEQNSDFKYQKVGKKKPNPWGLYDIYGNVVEWVLDQYDADYYKTCAKESFVADPWRKATQPYPHSVRGGSWDDEALMCRTAARRGSDRAWKMQDPQLPKSTWYFTDAQFVGFRLVRPLKVPSAEQMQKYWTSGVERD